ncbi:O-methyltransferase [Acidobacteriota bacterium]
MDSDLKRKLDDRVKDFLVKHRDDWKDLNISGDEGRALYDLILKNKCTRALEIGTSTGHSGIWIAWALSKTGGELITIELSEHRYNQAMKNFEEAGLSEYIDVMLGDAHKIVPQLEGPFDLIFCDADKVWYKNYLIASLPKLNANGCFTAHNVLDEGMGGIVEFLEYLKSLSYMDTTINNSSKSGFSVSYKRSEKQDFGDDSL